MRVKEKRETKRSQNTIHLRIVILILMILLTQGEGGIDVINQRRRGKIRSIRGMTQGIEEGRTKRISTRVARR